MLLQIVKNSPNEEMIQKICPGESAAKIEKQHEAAEDARIQRRRHQEDTLVTTSMILPSPIPSDQFGFLQV